VLVSQNNLANKGGWARWDVLAVLGKQNFAGVLAKPGNGLPATAKTLSFAEALNPYPLACCGKPLCNRHLKRRIGMKPALPVFDCSRPKGGGVVGTVHHQRLRFELFEHIHDDAFERLRTGYF
jgi:hypothetical protein